MQPNRICVCRTKFNLLGTRECNRIKEPSHSFPRLNRPPRPSLISADVNAPCCIFEHFAWINNLPSKPRHQQRSDRCIQPPGARHTAHGDSPSAQLCFTASISCSLDQQGLKALWQQENSHLGATPEPPPVPPLWKQAGGPQAAQRPAKQNLAALSARQSGSCSSLA